jgi:hypothetical protein
VRCNPQQSAAQAQAERRWRSINELSQGLDVDAIQTTHQVLNQLRNKLEEDQSDSPAELPLDTKKP